MNTADTINVVVLSDGKPGHESSSNGIIKSLQRICQIESQTIQVRLRFKFMRRFLRILLNSNGVSKNIPRGLQHLFMSLLYRTESIHNLPYCKLDTWIISAGGDTSFLNAWLSRHYGVRNIFASSLRGLKPSLFTVHVTTNSSLTSPNVVYGPIAPSPISWVSMEQEGLLFSEKYGLVDSPVVALLLGGDGAGYRYSTEYIRNTVAKTIQLCRKLNAKLILTTSRRTGLKTEKAIKPLLDTSSVIAYSCLYNHEPKKVMLKILGAADIVILTPESGSMITESITTGKPVYLLDLPPKNSQTHYESFLDSHIDAKRVKKVSLNQLSYISITRGTSYFKTLNEDPLIVLAKQLKTKILTRLET